MDYTTLANGTQVSRLCFGSLTVGPLQAGLSVDEGAAVLCAAIDGGVCFVDTAQYYRTYPYIKEAMRRSGKHDLVIATKTYAYTRELAQQAFDEARRELDRDYIDIFLLHEQESEHTLRGHAPALEYLYEQKAAGRIGLVGLSSHHVAGVEAAVDAKLDVVHPLLNVQGIGIVDGDRAAMERAAARAHEAGLFVYSMKPLGGGHLMRRADEALSYALELPYADAVALGMQSVDEVRANLEFFETGAFSAGARRVLDEKTRRLLFEDYCIACGACAKACPQDAISYDADGRPVCDTSQCVLCGYCGGACPEFAIKIV